MGLRRRDHPFSALTVGGDWSLARPKFECTVYAGLLDGEVHIATLGPGVDDIIGVAVCYGPGHSPGSTKEHLANESLGPGFKESQWHLRLLGVVPEHQRKGVAAAMMKVVEEKAKADRVSIVLETPREVDVFKLLFEIVLFPAFTHGSSDAEVKQAVDVLLAAFGEGDPFSALTVGGDWSLARPKFEAGVRTGLLDGEVHVATLGPEVKDIIGVAIWYGPGHSPGSTYVWEYFLS
ncbi:hypothetical protein C0993_006408 [Termitomyces sp. T159_Od127]|nr:hypothetical protein C0993_006408 [Termitomyces sp. T159_Od127]